jgi:hypothetical protein
MKVFLDEDVPVQVAYFLRPLLAASGVTAVDHVETVRWKGKKDRFLIPDCTRRGYGIFVTKDRNQLNDAEETQVIRKAGIHHVTFKMDPGRSGYARAVASIIAAMPAIVEDLNVADGQRLVTIKKIDGNAKRHFLKDPSVDPPRYWRAQTGGSARRPKKRTASAPMGNPEND